MIHSTMTPFSKFKFVRTQARRSKALSEVMPAGRNWAYFAVLADAYLNVNDGERHIRSFRDLQEALGSGDDLQALQMARTKGQLTEGRHELPDAVAGHLAKAGADSAIVRRWAFGAAEPVTTTIDISDIKEVWVGSDLEEVEVGDHFAQWYFRMRDDDPLIYLAVTGGPLLAEMRLCKDLCLEVSGEFVYAL